MVSKRLLIYFFLLSFIDLPSLCGLAPFINKDNLHRLVSELKNSRDTSEGREESTKTPEEKEALYIKQRTEHLNEHKAEERQLKKNNQFILLFDGTRLTDTERNAMEFRPGEMFLRKVIPLEKNKTIAQYMEDNRVKQRGEITGLKREGSDNFILISDHLSKLQIKGGDTFILTLKHQEIFQLKLDISALNDKEKEEIGREPSNKTISYSIPLYGSKNFSDYLYDHFEKLVDRFDTQITEFRKKDSTENISGILDKQIMAEGDSIVVRFLSREEKDKRELSKIFFSEAFSSDENIHSQSTISDTFRLNFSLSGVSEEDKISLGFLPGQLFYSVDVPVVDQNEIHFYLGNNTDLHSRFGISKSQIRKKNANEQKSQILENGDSILIYLTSQTGPDETLQTLFPPIINNNKRRILSGFNNSQDSIRRREEPPMTAEEREALSIKQRTEHLNEHNTLFPPKTFKVYFDLSKLSPSERKDLPPRIEKTLDIKDNENILFYLLNNRHWIENYNSSLNPIKRDGVSLLGEPAETVLKEGDVVTVFLRSKQIQKHKKDSNTFQINFDMSQLAPDNPLLLNLPVNQTIHLNGPNTIYFYLNDDLTRNCCFEFGNLRTNGGKNAFSGEAREKILKEGDVVTVILKPPRTFQIRYDVSELSASEKGKVPVLLEQNVLLEDGGENVLFYLKKNSELLMNYNVDILHLRGKGSEMSLRTGDVVTVRINSRKKTEHGRVISRAEQSIAAAKAEGQQVLQLFIGGGHPYYLKIDLNNQGKYLNHMMFSFFFNGQKYDSSRIQEKIWKPGDLLRIQMISEGDHSGILAKSA